MKSDLLALQNSMKLSPGLFSLSLRFENVTFRLIAERSFTDTDYSSVNLKEALARVEEVLQ